MDRTLDVAGGLGERTPATLVRAGPDGNARPAPAFRPLQTALALAVWLALAGPVAAEADPPLPPGEDPGGVAVALIDTGVNYTLPHIAGRLAREADGGLIGYDFHDEDTLPFDLAPGQDARRGRRHGTGVASILLREAPEARLAPYRFKGSDPADLARAVAAIAAGPARIVVMAFGGYERGDWEPFRDAAKAHDALLFVLSAGNDGRDIDRRPVYPAAFRLPNALVVTSTDAFGRLPPESNWGPETVDIATPGERIESIDHTGSQFRVSGSSYAVPRIAALAARLSARHPDWDAARLKAAITGFARPPPRERTKRTRHGWIANPARVAAD